MLKVTCLVQPDWSKELVFDDDCKVIRFGRTTGFEVKFPAYVTSVSSKHFSLKFEESTGTYSFHVSRQKPVYLNGKPVFSGTELSQAGTVTLGKPDGPALRLEPLRKGSNLEKTDPLEFQPSLDEVAVEGQKKLKHLSLIVGGVAAAIVGLIAAYVFLF